MVKKDTVGSRIAGLRREKNFSQSALAEALSTKEQTISRERVAKWEVQENLIPRAQDIIMLADFFGVSCDYILRGQNPENIVVVRDLGLNDHTIERMREYKETSVESYGILNHLFDLRYGYMPWILECIDKALEIGKLQSIEQRRLNREDNLDEPKMQLENGMEIEHSIIIEAMIKKACDAFEESMREYIVLSTRGEE